MKGILKGLALVLILSLSNTNVMAQSFLKKLSKAAESITAATTNTESSKENTAADSIDVKALLNEKIKFSVMKAYDVDSNGDTIKNEDGTMKMRYYIVDGNGNPCSANKAKEIVNSRTKEVTKILANVGKGALTGVGTSLLGGGNKKDALKGAAAGAAAGLALSSDEIKNIKSLNKELKAYKKTIDAYEKTFSEEGELLDASVDLSDIDGIDFESAETLSKNTLDILKTLENEPEVDFESLEI